ncbi:hypothetical protein CMUS01_13532 [Colletotrichum musicola]|uniref:Uncharacterized protein n=1 Tax=Colletotrichum musicola TaxID=2175873 RepID=A0A8H6MVT9_9PEZI|nr:hypothetical protein CMUS01_13532 [Colletotrichum musicola]
MFGDTAGCVLTHRLSRIRQIEIALTTGSLHPTSVAAPNGSDTTAVRPKGGGRWHDGLAGHAGYSTNAAPTNHPPVTGSALCSPQGLRGQASSPSASRSLALFIRHNWLCQAEFLAEELPVTRVILGLVEERSSTLAVHGLAKHSKKNDAARFDKATEA